MSHLIICLKQKNYNFYTFCIFLTLPSTQTDKVIDLIFFNELALNNWAMNMHFNPVPII